MGARPKEMTTVCHSPISPLHAHCMPAAPGLNASGVAILVSHWLLHLLIACEPDPRAQSPQPKVPFRSEDSSKDTFLVSFPLDRRSARRPACGRGAGSGGGGQNDRRKRRRDSQSTCNLAQGNRSGCDTGALVEKAPVQVQLNKVKRDSFLHSI